MNDSRARDMITWLDIWCSHEACTAVCSAKASSAFHAASVQRPQEESSFTTTFDYVVRLANISRDRFVSKGVTRAMFAEFHHAQGVLLSSSISTLWGVCLSVCQTPLQWSAVMRATCSFTLDCMAACLSPSPLAAPFFAVINFIKEGLPQDQCQNLCQAYRLRDCCPYALWCWIQLLAICLRKTLSDELYA